MNYQERAKTCINPTAKRLFTLMTEKKTNLALSADVTKKEKLLTLANQLGPEICVLKTHIDIIEDFDQELITQLQQLAQKHEFLLFEDRKFSDIGNTVKLQYEKGIYRIANWANIIDAFTTAGPGVIEGLKESGLKNQCGLLLLAELSSKGNLATGEYTKVTTELAKQHQDFVMGFITQHKLLDDPHFINLTPGIKLQSGTDKLGQQYNTPQKAISENGTDIIIVGRGIIQADNPLEEAKKYRQAAWDAYLQLPNN